jgi:hypothetical protein
MAIISNDYLYGCMYVNGFFLNDRAHYVNHRIRFIFTNFGVCKLFKLTNLVYLITEARMSQMLRDIHNI